MKNNSVSLTLSKDSDFFERASLFNALYVNSHSIVELPEDSQVYRLKPEKVKNIASQVITQIEVDNVTPESLKVTPLLFVGTDKSVTQSGVFWRCLWVDSDGASQALWLDDESALMVGIMFDKADSSDQTKVYTDSYTQTASQQKLDLLADYCRVNYAADKVEVNDEGYGIYNIILMREKDGEKSVYSISVSLQNNELVYFNV